MTCAKFCADQTRFRRPTRHFFLGTNSSSFYIFATSGRHVRGTSKWLILKDGFRSSLQKKKKSLCDSDYGKENNEQISPLFTLILPPVAEMKIKVSPAFLIQMR